ncbi:MAG: hypothetical protein JWM98_3434, partial [Thermoleophilia bacterium]|nr:hypothetical protein [Thermoleophilia bacterium]
MVEGPHTQNITHSAAGDPAYAALAIPNIVANITDDDAAGVDIAPATPLAVTEGGATATYTAVLRAQPASNVTLTLTPNAQVSTSAPSLVFTTANWNVPQTVTVTAVDDLVVETSPHPGLITHATTSADPIFNGLTVSDVAAAITDNDVPGVTVTPTSTTATEGGANGSYSVKLDTQPTASVTVNMASSAQLAAITPLTFTTANWNTPQTVTVVATDDFVAEGAHAATITHDTASTDPFYGAGSLTIASVAVAITDNDNAGVQLTPATGLSGSEGGAAVTYGVKLTSQPTADVTITLTGDADGTPSPSTLTFTSGTWNTTQTVTVAIVDDAIAEGAHTTTIAHAVASSDPTYAAVVAPSESIAITDNDTASIIVTPATPGPVTTTEGGAPATYTIALGSEPTAPVTFTLTAPGGQATAAPGTLTFTPVNWMTPQTVTVTAVDDAVVEASPHAAAVHHVVAGDPVYAALTVADMGVAITDNDVAGVVLAHTGGTSTVAELGAGDTITAVLTSQPTASVTVTFAGVQATTTAPTITFTTANWNTPQVVPITAIDDFVVEGPHTGTIDSSASSSDANYGPLASNTLTIDVVDNDVAGVVVTQPASDDLDEATPLVGQSYTVHLTSQPTAPITLTPTADAQLTVAPATLTFTAANWATDQTITAKPIDDAVAEASPHTGVVTHDTSGDPSYASGVLTIDPVDFDITDNDTPDVLVSPTAPHAVTEGGATDTYTIVLGSQPTSSVTITPLSTQLDWSVPSITFTTANWNVPQTITLRAIDDTVDEASPHTGVLTHTITSVDPGYNGFTAPDVSANITDNDTSDLVLTPSSGLSVDEAGALPAATYVATLSSTPSAPVTVTLSTTGTAQVAFAPSTVTLDSTNWSTGATVTVTAIQDAVHEGAHTGTIHHAMASTDANYGGETGPDQVVGVLDDDVASIVVTPTGGSTDVAEAGATTDTYAVHLTSQPTANVVVSTVTADGQTTAAPASLTFTAANWNTDQVVTVAAVDDAVVEAAVHPGVVTHTSASADVDYDAMAGIPSVTANVTDNDVAGVTVTPAGGSLEVTEGGAADTVTVTLTSQPTAPVTVTLTGDADVTALPSPQTIAPAAWATGITFTVTAVDDAIVEGLHTGTVGIALASTDTSYGGSAVPNQVAQVTDNDSAGIAVVQSSGTTVLDEGSVATTDTLSVVLTSQPSSDVVVTLTPTAGQLTTSPSPLTFTSTDWNTPQVVTATVVDDAVDEASPHTASIQFGVTSSDTDYGGFVLADVNVAITDNDSTAVIATPLTGISVAEAGTTSQVVGVKLGSQPLGNVEVSITSDAQVTTSPAGPLVFTTANWNTVQNVTITAVDDAIDEADPHPGSVTLGISSPGAADPAYDALADIVLAPSVADNDTNGITITKTAGTDVDEADATAIVTYSVVLDAQPSGNVTVTAVPDGQLLANATTLTFTSANWNVAQTVDVHAFDDAIDEASPHPGILAFTAGGLDPVYAAMSIPAKTVNVLDDDTSGILVSPLATTVDEDRTMTGSYSVELQSVPTANVTVTFANPDGELDLPVVRTLTFTPATWNVPQVVSFQALDDSVDEPVEPHSGTITHTWTSTDPNYAATAPLAVSDVVVDILDNDLAGFDFTPATPAPTVNEAGATSATYVLTMRSAPTANVDVAFASAGGDLTVSPANHTFTSANWATPVTITVTAVDDLVAETSPELVPVTHTITTLDATYGALTIPDVGVSVVDNDVASYVVTPTTGLSVDETGPTSTTYTIALSSQPASTVTIALSGDADGTVAPGTLTFTTANWATPQTVTVTAVDDLVTEVGDTTTITHVVTGDPMYAGLPLAPQVVSVVDNDVPGIEVDTATGLDATEGGATDTYRIRLKTQPTADVDVSFATGTQVDPIGTITFTTVNWNSWQALTVTATDDDVDEASPHAGTIQQLVTSTDATYGGWTLADQPVAITDDDTAAIVVDDLGGVDVDEANVAATDTFTVKLGSQPTAPITVTAVPDAQVGVAGAPLTFTASDWNVAQVVTVAAIDDPIQEPDPHPGVVTVAATGDATYAALSSQTVTADVADDDTAAVIVDPGTLSVAEAGTTSDTYDIVLGSKPTANVTVTLAPDAQVTTSPDLTFTPADWSVPQTVTVTAVDDAMVETDPHPGVVTQGVGSTDPFYAAIAPSTKLADVADDDAPGITVDELGGVAVTEGGATHQYSVVLDAQPSGTVTVTPTPDAQVTTVPSPLTFDSTNWNVAQLVTVAAVDDPVSEVSPHPGTITNLVSAADPLWSSVTAAPVTAQITDNDVAAINVTASSPYALDEDTPAPGTTVSYSVVLATPPTADVTIALTVPGDLTASPTSLTFTSATWNTPQTVTFGAIDDAVTETPVHTRTIVHAVTSADPIYGALTVADIVANVTDNDTPDIIASKTALAATEGGATDTFTLVLGSQPTADVTIALTGTQVSAATNPVVFSPVNWNIPQTVTVTATDDLVDEHPDTHAGKVAFSVTSSDLTYDAWTALSDIPVAITDNDTAGVTVTPGATPITVAEAGTTTATYAVVLTSQPAAAVGVAVATPDGQTTASPASLSFTPANWNVPQTVTVAAVDDAVDEADPHVGLVTHTVTSTDPKYAAVATIDQAVSIADDDTAAIVVSAATVTLDEATLATTGTFTVKLASQPAGDVVVTTATPDGQTVAAPASLTFTTANWATPQTVTVTVVDDPVVEADPHTGLVVTAATSALDAAYNAIDPADVTATIADNDVAGVTITENGTPIADTHVEEGGATDSYDVVLTSQPSADVTITVTGGLQASAS